MGIYQYGQLNTSALGRPDKYVQIIPPQLTILNGVPTNFAGIVGSASWGPVNSPVTFSGVTDGTQAFGPLNARTYDLMTAANVAALQGNAANYVGVRVTDGTDTAATGTVGNAGALGFWQALANAINTGSGTPRGPSNIIVATATATGLTLTARYTGSLGAQIKVSLAAGAAANSYRVVVNMPGQIPEIFDNLGAAQVTPAPVQATGSITFTTNPTASSAVTIGGTAVTFVASNPTGNQVLIGASTAATLANLLTFLQLSADTNLVKFTYGLASLVLNVTARYGGVQGNALTIATTVAGATVSGATLTGGSGFDQPALTTAQLTGGTDGASSITPAIMLGSDVTPRTGMYALRGTRVSVAMLADVTDITTFATQQAFGQGVGQIQGEGIYMVVARPPGDTIAAAIAAKQSAGLDTAWLKIMFGDWITFNDTYNGVQRKVSPQGFALGRLANLSPHLTSLNKAILGVVSTEKTAANQIYSDAELDLLSLNGFDVITNPVPAGNFFGMRTGRNASSNAGIHSDNYPRLTDYIAVTINNGIGRYVGELQSQQPNDPTRIKVKATIEAFLQNMKDINGPGNVGMIDDFQVVLDLTNNTPNLIRAGYMIGYVKVLYLAVVEYFVLNLEGGQTVVITRQNQPPLLAA